MLNQCPLYEKNIAQYREPERRRHAGMKLWSLLAVGLVCSGFVFAQTRSWGPMDETYIVFADFESVAGLETGAPIEICGVQVGAVVRIFLTDSDSARVEMRLRKSMSLPDDSVVSVKTRGLIGDKILHIARGGSLEIVAAGGVLFDTQPGFDLEDLIAKFIFKNEV